MADSDSQPQYGMDSQENMSFTNLLQGDSNLDNQFLSEASPPQVQILTSKTRRRANFTVEEDKLLVSAWLNTSLDPVHGNEQKHEAFYERIAAYFEEYKEFDSERTANSLSCRWSIINSCTNKFCGFLAQIESRNESGITEQDKIRQAKTLYKTVQKSNFQFEHCWLMLREEPKWLQHRSKEKPKKGLPQTLDSINQACGDDVSHDGFVDLERPIGRKAEKAKRKKKVNEKEDVAQFMEKKTKFLEDAHEVEKELIRLKEKKVCMEEMRMTEKINIEKERMRREDEREYERMRREDERMRREDEKIRIEEERLCLKKMKEEERVMMVDTSGLSARQQAYYEQRQMEILESRKIDFHT